MIIFGAAKRTVKTILPTRYDEFIDSIQFMRKPAA